MALTLAILIALTISYRLLRANLSYPIQPFGGDAPLAVYIVKALGENAFLQNPHVGAPFGLDYYDCYQPDVLHFIVLKIGMALTHDAMRTLNLYYLGGFFLIGWSALYVFRRLRFSTTVAFFCSVLYAFTPSHLYVSISHIFLSEYYLLPLVVLLAIQIMCDYPRSKEKEIDSVIEGGESTAPWKFAISMGVLVGMGGAYYAFYSVLLLSVAGLYAWFRVRRKRHALVAASAVVSICATIAACLSPVLAYRHRYGANPELPQRSFIDSNVYSLKIADLYLPSPDHPIKELRALSMQYNYSLPYLNVNESQFSTLGIFGAVGLTITLVYPLFAAQRKDGEIMTALILLTLVAVLYSTTEGIGTLFSYLITPEIRSNTRFVFFIAFFSISSLGLFFDRLLRALPQRPVIRLVSGAMLVILSIAGVYDAGATQVKPHLQQLNTEFNSDDKFVKTIESQLTNGDAVLQLPFQSFPESGGPYQMESYDPLRAYVHSKNLRWSYPSMRGRENDEWIKHLSALPVPTLLPQAVLSGFKGIFIDRVGYPDPAGVEAQFQAVLGTKPMESEDKRLAFFSLVSYASAMKKSTPPTQWRQWTQEATHKPDFFVDYASGVYQLETQGSNEWHWCNHTCSIAIANSTGKPQEVRFSGVLFTGYPGESKAVLQSEVGVLNTTASSAGKLFSWRMTLHAGFNRVAFSTDAPQVQAPADPRVLYLRLTELRITRLQ